MTAVPLSHTQIRVDDDGRIHLAGATLATGYLGRPDLTAAAFAPTSDGRRWFRTDDVGHLDDDGRWHVDGRLDDLITTGGLKVAPRLVEDALTSLPGIAEAVVVATPDEHWGQAVSAAVVLTEPAPARPRGTHGGRAARAAARHTPGACAAPTAPGAARSALARAGQAGPRGGRRTASPTARDTMGT